MNCRRLEHLCTPLVRPILFKMEMSKMDLENSQRNVWYFDVQFCIIEVLVWTDVI